MNIIYILKTVLSALQLESLPFTMKAVINVKITLLLAIIVGASVPALQDYSVELLSLARDIALSFSVESA